MYVRQILQAKGTDVASVPPDTTVRQVVSSLAERGIGALVVSSDGRDLDGIVSERDVVRGLGTTGVELLDAPVSEIMTADVQTCAPGDRVAELMARMTAGRFRHLPVVDDGELVGIISIGDVVKQRLGELETEAQQMIEYIRGA